MSQITAHYSAVKTALKRDNLSEPFLASKYRFSPYMACQHGCLYCDGRAERYYVEGQFDRDIVIRSNLPEVLEKELPKLREKGIVSIGSGISDAYQPVEAGERLMARCAEILGRHRFPAAVLTKSALIQRDIDLWVKVHENAGFILMVSLTFSDDRLRRIFEPRASSVDQRLELLKMFKDRGCHTGVLAMPFIPLISDDGQNIRLLFERLAEAGVDFVIPGSLTLRPGRQKDTFMELVTESFPEKRGEIEKLYAEQRQSGMPLLSYRKKLFARVAKIQRNFETPNLIPHSIYRGKVQRYDEIHLLLHHMVSLYSERGVDVAPLREGLDRYLGWLRERKREYNRRRSWRYSDLDGELERLVRNGELKSIVGNAKLCSFIEQIVVGGKTLDYLTLRTEGTENQSAAGIRKSIS